MVEFLEKYITTKFKNKLIILDNASSRRNHQVKEVINKHNITNTIRKIPQEKYKNIFKGAYERPEKYVAKNKT